MTALKEEPSSLTKSYKFLRRADIGSELRMKIAVMVLVFGYHGQVTSLSEKYSVSRSFIYGLKNLLAIQLDGLFDSNQAAVGLSKAKKRLIAWEKILFFRLVGKCSLSAISQLLSFEEEALPHSVCFISQFLDQLGSKLGKLVNWKGKVHFACDEVFMIGHQPVLVTVDPVSSAILQIEYLNVLDKEAWVRHWQALKKAGIIPIGLVKDDGVILRAAQAEELTDTPVQLDTFHTISYQLGIFDSRLKKAVDKAILYEWERKRVMENAATPKAKAKKQAKYEKACEQTLEAIENYEAFRFLYNEVLEQFNVFDHRGIARDPDFALQEVACAFELMRELKIPKLTEQIEEIEKCLPQLFNFLAKAKLTQFELEEELEQVPSYFWIYAWQNDKKSRKTKHLAKSRRLRQKSVVALELLQEHYQLEPSEFESLKMKVFQKLDGIVQSSALVEMINSLLRPYMNEARNQLSQEQLNIIRFYLNHRVYQRGKRKGFAPIELLRGEKLEKNWRELLLEIAAA